VSHDSVCQAATRPVHGGLSSDDDRETLEAYLAVERRRKRLNNAIIRAALAISAAPVASTVLVSFGLVRATGLNCWEQDVDISSGRIRHSYFLYWCPVYRSVEDSFLTEALSIEERGKVREEWRKVLVVAPPVAVSPHFAYHLAIYQIRSLHYIWRSMKYTPEARRKSARRVLQLWQQDGCYFAAERYLQSLREEAIRAGASGPLGWTGSDPVPQPIMPLELPVEVRSWELTVYPRSHDSGRPGLVQARM